MTNESTTLFRLEDNPQDKGGVTVLLLLAIAGEIVVLVLSDGDLETGLVSALFLFALSLSVVVYAWLMSRGLIEITDERLELRISVERRSIRWSDITEAQVRTISQLGTADRFFTTVAGAHQDRRLVEISLRRSIRGAILLWRKSDPDVAGLPMFPLKLIRVYVSDPEGLVHAVNTQVARKANAASEDQDLQHRALPAKPRGALNPINNDPRRGGIFLVYLAGAIFTGAGGSVGMYLIDAPPILFVVLAITCLAMVYGGVMLARRVP